MIIRRVHGNGPKPCDIALFGERPGKAENAKGKPFVGPAGQMLDQYLFHNSGIDRSNVFVSNVCRTYAEHPPTAEELQRDRNDLIRELYEVNPKFIGLLGQHAVNVFLPEIKLHWAHGLQFDISFTIGPGKTMCLVHPAAGLHQSKLQGITAYDFERFGMMIRGELTEAPKDSIKTRYELFEEPGEAEIPSGPIALDTEGTLEKPWGLSWTNGIGWAQVQKATAHQLLIMEGELVVFHHSLHDFPIVRKLSAVPSRFTDTMIMAHLLQTEPLGLKDLARRHCGMIMSAYSDIVRDARREVRLMYLAKVMEWADENRRGISQPVLSQDTANSPS